MLNGNVIRRKAKFMRAALAATYIILSSHAVVSAQTPGTNKGSRNHRPTVALLVSSPDIKLRCPGLTVSSDSSDEVGLSASATDPDGDSLSYKFSVTGGRIIGTGAQVRWNLEGVKEGRYKATVKVTDGRGGRSTSFTYLWAYCDSLYMCPDIGINPSVYDVEEGQSLIFRADINGGDRRVKPSYRWKISAGKIVSGQRTPVITVNTKSVGDQGITATVEVRGYLPECGRTRAITVKTHRKN